ncbi:MAG: hypothetical protein FWF91_00895 [Coriobacteriia bacterium]|nr:hypothetical protein [Coriobacteriia bacterium]
MCEQDKENLHGDKPRVVLPKVGGLGGGLKPPPTVKSETQETVAGVEEQPDLEQHSFFHWKSDTKEDK